MRLATDHTLNRATKRRSIRDAITSKRGIYATAAFLSSFFSLSLSLSGEEEKAEDVVWERNRF